MNTRFLHFLVTLPPLGTWHVVSGRKPALDRGGLQGQGAVPEMVRKWMIYSVLCWLSAATTVLAQSNVELLVKCEGGPSGEAARAADAAIGGKTVRRFEALGWHLVRLPEGMTPAVGLAAYASQPGVITVEPNRALNRTPPPPPPPTPAPSTDSTGSIGLHSTPPDRVVPNDPNYSSQWNLKRIGMEQAWAISTGSTNVVVVVIDTGVDYTHPDLAPNMWRNPGETGLDTRGRDKSTNGVDDDGNGYADDVHGIDTITDTGDPMDRGFFRPSGGLLEPNFHGTHCASIIGAVGGNQLGITGVNWTARIMAIAAAGGNEDLDATKAWISRVLSGIDYILTMKKRGVPVRVVSNSYGWFRYSAALEDALAALAAEDVLFVFAAGNDPFNLDTTLWDLSTSNLPNIVNVAATDRPDELASWTTYGRTTVHLAAPGVEIPLLTKVGGITSGGGTSYACPQVAGVAALLCAIRPGITVDEIKTAILGSVDPRPSIQGKVRTNGRLNAARALQSLTNTHSTALVLFASPAGLRANASAPLQILFNRPMNRASVEASFRSDPPVVGTVEWSEDGRLFTLRPRVPFERRLHTLTLAGAALDTEGGSLDGNFNGIREGSPDDYVWTFDFQLANDNFAGAEPIKGRVGSVSGSNRRATAEFDDPNFVGGVLSNTSLWYRWIAPETGWFVFDLTRSTSFDSLLGVYAGSSLADLRELASNDDQGPLKQSRVSVPVDSGESYSVLVGGNLRPEVNQGIGTFTLRWYPTPPPVITSFIPQNAVTGRTVTFFGTDFTGTTRVTLDGNPVPFTGPTNVNYSDLRLVVTLPTDARSGTFTVETPHGNATSANPLTIIEAPSLALEARLDGRVVLSWPEQATGYVLQVSDRLGPSANWRSLFLPEASPPEPGRVRVIESPPRSVRYYRLRQP